MTPRNLREDGVDVDDSEALGAAPSDADLERAIASVPGVASAEVRRSSSGRSRLRIRLSAGEDPQRVSWAVAATLRERFSIMLDPDDIRPRPQDASAESEQRSGPALADAGPADAGSADVTSVTDAADLDDVVEPGPDGDTPPAELDETRDRLTSAAREALAGLRRSADRPGVPGSQEAPDAGRIVEGELSPVLKHLFRLDEPVVQPVPEPAEVPGDGHDVDRDDVPLAVSAAGLAEPAAVEDALVEGITDVAPDAGSDEAAVSPEREIGEGGSDGGDGDDEASREVAGEGDDARPGAEEPASRPPRVGPPWPVPTDRAARWTRRESPPFTTASAAASQPTSTPAAVEDDDTPGGDPATTASRPQADEPAGSVPAADAALPDPADASDGRDEVSEVPVARPAPGTHQSGFPDVRAGSVVTRDIRSRRAAIRHLDTRRDERDVQVTATLEHAGRSAHGEVTTVPTTHGVFRAVAEATIAALGVLVGPALVAGVDRVVVQPAEDPANAMVAVSLVTDRGEETLLGTSLVRGDPEHAVMRATLDALNRRVGELAAASDPSAGDPAA